ncbi:hypothetical protein AAG906_004758 [Vitis piasezkii]
MKTEGKSKGMTEADSDQGGQNADSFAYARILIHAELIDPALKGTINVLRSCSKVPSVKRVVVTSSLASVLFTGEPLTPEVLIDESWFSDPVLCKESKQWYVLSKTLAEEAAWKFSKENGIDMVTINPGWVIGPLLQPTLNLSAEQVLNLINDAQMTNLMHHPLGIPRESKEFRHSLHSSRGEPEGYS